MKAAAVLMEILRAAGVRYLFGNPGTTELPFLDALPDSRLEYVVALQEAAAVAAADGYAQASGKLGVVNVHVAPGLANGISILHNAARAKTPLVVTAGQQDTRFLMDQPILAADLVRMAEPFTKWAYEIRRAAEAPSALRRALKVALTPPTGPVFLSLPMDLMGEVVEDAGEGPPELASRALPEAGAVGRAAQLLAAGKAPLVIAGDGVARSGGVAELTALAELLGARVHGEPVYRRTNFPGNHPLWRGGLFPSPAGVRKALDEADVVLIVGASVFTWFLHTEGAPFRRGLTVVQVDDDPWEIGRSYRVSLGIVADPRETLAALTRALGALLTDAARKVVATIGDGSVMYSPQALWTAAHARLPITYVVPNNSSYAILKSGMLSLDLESAKRGIYPGMDLVNPEIDYTGLARSLGVRAERVEKPGELRDVLTACLAHPGPSLVDLAIDRGFKAML